MITCFGRTVRRISPTLIFLLALLSQSAPAAEIVWLDELDLKTLRQGRVQPHANRNTVGNPLTIAGKTYERGIGTHAFSFWRIDLAAGAERFTAQAGMDDAGGTNSSGVFQVYVDGLKRFDSGLRRAGEAARAVDLDVRGKKWLLLRVNDGDNGIEGDLANWVDAKLTVTGPRPRGIWLVEEKPYLLTPEPGPTPRLNGPKVYGCRPGNPFIYRVPAQGERPLKFTATGLPASLRLDATTGVVTGIAPPPGEYRVEFTVRSRHGRDRRSFRIVSGEKLSLTPPMGWNHWNTHYDRITDQKMREATDILVASGMADVGYAYVNIDDAWMNAEQHSDPQRVGPLRDADGNILPNKHFPDMKGLTDYIHARGLKAGIYSSPGPKTCCGFAGSYQHEAQDIRQIAAWGFDFFKYDWCHYEFVVKGDHSLPALQLPYRIMGEELKKQPRDIFYNLCQYGMGNVWEWGPAMGGHSWRTANDIGFELDRVLEIALHNIALREWHRPGAWNDPDYLQLGHVGRATAYGHTEPVPLTPTEQYSMMSLWALMAAPLFYSGDLTKLDKFTLNILCNPEVIEVNQDDLGQCARTIPLAENHYLLVKDLADGAKAVGLVNWGEFPAQLTADWSSVGLKGRQPVRDVWRHKSLGNFRNRFTAEVPRHGVLLLRVGS